MTNVPKLTDALLTLENRVATLTLNRHDLRNALTGSALIDDIVTTADWVNHCDEVSVLDPEMYETPSFVRKKNRAVTAAWSKGHTVVGSRKM